MSLRIVAGTANVALAVDVAAALSCELTAVRGRTVP